MKRTVATIGLLLAAGCSSSSSGGPAQPGDDSGTDATSEDGSSSGGSSSGGSSSGGSSSGGSSSGGSSSGGSSSGGSTDGGTDADASSAPDGAADGSCTGAWLVAPTVSALLPDGGTVVLHALGAGTQDYACIGTPIDGGADAGDAGESFAWTLQGPDALLKDCNGATIGHHFPDGGSTSPEWQTTDGTYVTGHKLIAYTPDGGSGSVPWLLLSATGHGGTGTLSTVTYIQRLDTDGGNAPSTGCDYTTDAGATVNVPYTADYYFYGP